MFAILEAQLLNRLLLCNYSVPNYLRLISESRTLGRMDTWSKGY